MRLVAASGADVSRLGDLRNALYRWNLALLACFVLACIVALKWAVLHRGVTSDSFVVYSIVVTSFTLSRFAAASLHERAMEACYSASRIGYQPDVSFVIPCMNEEDARGSTPDRTTGHAVPTRPYQSDRRVDNQPTRSPRPSKRPANASLPSPAT